MASASAVSPPPSNTLTGSRVNFMLEGNLVGFASNLSYSHNYTLAPLNVIGSIETIQHIPVQYQAGITFNNFRVLGRTLRTLGLWPRIGKNPTDHMMALIQIPELTAVCEDVVTQTIILIAEGVRIESSAVQMAANSLMQEDISCVCRRILLEGDSI